MALLPAVGLARPDVDLTDEASLDAVPWSQVGPVINAAAYTAVDAAETEQGRRDCWAVVTARPACREGPRPPHPAGPRSSSDYVFDGRDRGPRRGRTALPAGRVRPDQGRREALVAALPALDRTSGSSETANNFVATMARLADTGVSPSVVADQYGRLTFADDLAAGIVHLATADRRGHNHANDGPTRSWADIAKRVLELRADPPRTSPRPPPRPGPQQTRGPQATTQHPEPLAKVHATGTTADAAQRLPNIPRGHAASQRCRAVPNCRRDRVHPRLGVQ